MPMLMSAAIKAECRRHRPQASNWRFFSSEKPTTALFTWGVGSDGQMGHSKFHSENTVLGGEVYIQEEPRRLIRSKSFVSVAIGGTYTLAVNDSGNLFGFGDIFGKDKNKTPEIICPDTTFTHVAAGTKHAAAVDTNGNVHTWGCGGGWYAGGGQLGHNSYDAVAAPKLVEAFTKYGAKASKVAVGEQHTLILTTDGETLGCGVGEFGRVGTGSTSDVCVPTSLDVLMDEDVTQVVTGTHHSIVLTVDGKVYTWGKNDTGALGHSDSHIDMYSLEEYPRLLDCQDMGDKTVYVAAGSGRSAAVTSEGRLFLWGRNMGHIPAVLDGTLFEGLRVIKVALGGESGKSVIAVITEDDGLWTFGDGSSKMIGCKGADWKCPTPKRVPSFVGKRVLDIYCGPGQHIIAKVVVDND